MDALSPAEGGAALTEPARSLTVPLVDAATPSPSATRRLQTDIDSAAKWLSVCAEPWAVHRMGSPIDDSNIDLQLSPEQKAVRSESNAEVTALCCH